MNKKGLGKGLQALISANSQPVSPAPESNSTPVPQNGEINIKLIKPNTFQPRTRFDQQKLEELAASIRQHGVVQPIVVRPQGDYYELVAGERRWRACMLLGLDMIPAIVQNYTDNQAGEIALIENLQREDLDPVEEALAYKKLQDEFGLTQEVLAEKVGKSRSAVANSMRLLALPALAQAYLTSGKISAGHGRALLPLGRHDKLEDILREIVERQLSVREIENKVKKIIAPPSSKAKNQIAIAKDPDLLDLEAKLRGILGTRVKIYGSENKGKIEIEYYGADDLQRILDLVIQD